MVPKGSDLCKTTSNFIWGQLLLLGEGIPDPGDIFNTGSTLFKGIADKMGLAIPGTNWIGQAADAYLNQNIAQELRAKVMGDVDYLTGNLISNQAKYVSDTRDVLRAMKKMIDGVYKVCKGLEKVPILGWLWSWELALPMSGIAMATVGGALLYLTIMTLMNVTNLKGLLGRLLEMLTTLPKFPGLPNIPGIGDLWPPKWPDIRLPPIPNIPGLPEIIWPPKLPNIPIPGLPNFPWPPNINFPIPGLPDFPWPPNINFPGWKLPIPELPGIQFPPISGIPGINFPFPTFPIPGFPGLPGLPSIPDMFPGLPGLGDLFGGIGQWGVLPSWTDLAALPDFLGGFAGLPTLSFANLLDFAQLPNVSSLTATMSQLQHVVAAAGGPGQLGSMAGQQASMISSQASQGGQQATLVSHKEEDDEDGATMGGAGAERAPIDAGTNTRQGNEGTLL